MTDWSDIVRRHGPLVWRTASRLLSNEHDTSDCFQDTFLAAVEFARREEVRHWPAVLKRIATARALERLRKRYRDASRGEALPDDPLLDEQAPRPSQQAELEELADNLRTALTQIPAPQADVFCLVVLEGFSYREVSQLLDVSVSHAGVLLHRAKSNLQDLLHSHRSLVVDPGLREEDS